MHSKLRKIRIEMRYSIRDFAELIGFGRKHSTYQCYEEGKRSVPHAVIQEAQAAYQRDRIFFTKEMPQRIDAATPNGCSNEAKKGAW